MTVDGWSEMKRTIENRFQKYIWVIAATAAIGVVMCMLSTDFFWGLLISVCMVPIACIFNCGVVAVFEVCLQRRALLQTPSGIEIPSNKTNVADRMLELRPFPLADQRWIDLFQELETNGTPLSKVIFGKVERTGRELVHYSSKKLGVNLYGEDEGYVATIHFGVGPTYIGDLPFGLKPDFRLSDVNRIIGPAIERTKIAERHPDEFGRAHYSFNSYRVIVWYFLADESLYDIKVI